MGEVAEEAKPEVEAAKKAETKEAEAEPGAREGTGAHPASIPSSQIALHSYNVFGEAAPSKISRRHRPLPVHSQLHAQLQRSGLLIASVAQSLRWRQQLDRSR